MKVDILLATYNGAAFLEEQLQSILDQSYTDWHLYIRDDGSTDATPETIKKFTTANHGKTSWIEDSDGSLGAAANFSRLMGKSEAPYIMFSDQDDVWEPDKVEVMMKAMRDIEDKKGFVPLYLFSDLSMIDDNGNILAPSLWEAEGLDPERIELNQLLVQNVPYGCATMINRELRELATPIDPNALQHDHWMVLLAAAAGVVRSVSQTTIRHRIHGENASRSKNPIRLARDRSASAVIRNKNFNQYFQQLESQAQAVKERLLERNYSNVTFEVLDDFINLRHRGIVARKYLMVKRRYFKHSRMQSLKWLLRI